MRTVQFMHFKRIILSDLIFFLIITLLTVLSIFSYTRINTLNRESDYVYHRNLVKLKLEQLFSAVKDAESGQRGYLLTEDDIHLQSYNDGVKNHRVILKDLDSMIGDDKDQQRRFRELQWLVTKRVKRLNTVLDSTRLHPPEMGNFLSEGKIVMDQLRQLIAKMIDYEDETIKKRTKEKNYSAFITPLYSLLLSVFAIFAVVLSYFFLRTETRLRFLAQDSINKLNDYFKDLPMFAA